MSQQKHTNQLINETSPYLLQHAHNPVNWYPWGPEAIERARREDKPILLSIGYAACHWCHVMERESFEDEEIARIMNENFVCIKVDREERPDLDSIYMSAVQMMTGHGGWPLTVFLTPDLKPFYGGTYYPPTDRGGLPGFPRVLLAVADAYKNRKDEIETSADAITEELRKVNRFRSSSQILTTEVLDQAYLALARSFDRVNGGFGSAPKFPPSMALMFLLRQHKRTNSSTPLEMVELTLDKMASGGIYDHLGGGFHRYSVDARWLVPHFEKMLYDNALLARAYLYAYQVTNKWHYRQVSEETLEYVLRDMTDRHGGFYSSEDADSEGEEGKFYLWTLDEVIKLLGPDEGRLFAAYFNITDRGNFEHGKSILNTPQTLEQVAKEYAVEPGKLQEVIGSGKKKLFYARQQRVRPTRDDKILTSWNGLMMTAFAEAANILERDDYREVARKNADFILKNLMRGGRLLHTYREGQAKLSGYLDDYANFIEGLLALYEATFEIEYFKCARELADVMIEQFWDESESGFFFTPADQDQLITRVKDYFDNATPSGNSVGALVLLKLALLTGETKYQRCSLEILRSVQQAMARYPSAFGYLLCALDFYLSSPKEIAIIGRADSHEVRSFLAEIYSRFVPNKVVALSEPGDEQASASIALLKDRLPINGKPTVYVCQNYVCLAPATTVEELASRLEE
jgi:uncharacterized protein YyaL (SSP411 family)